MQKMFEKSEGKGEETMTLADIILGGMGTIIVLIAWLIILLELPRLLA